MHQLESSSRLLDYMLGSVLAMLVKNLKNP